MSTTEVRRGNEVAGERRTTSRSFDLGGRHNCSAATTGQTFRSGSLGGTTGGPVRGQSRAPRSIRVGLTRSTAVHVTDRADRGADRHLHPWARPIRRPPFPPCHRRRGFLPGQHPQGPPTLRAHGTQLLQAAHCPHHDPGVGDRKPSSKGITSADPGSGYRRRRSAPTR